MLIKFLLSLLLRGQDKFIKKSIREVSLRMIARPITEAPLIAQGGPRCKAVAQGHLPVQG